MKRTPETLAALDATIKLMERTASSHFDMAMELAGPVRDRGTKSALRSCGSTACIAGFVELANASGRVGDAFDLTRLAQDRLQLTTQEAGELFWSNFGATKPEALATLRHLRETGRVKWIREADGT